MSDWNVPHDPRPPVAPADAQWTESDFERISQTAGLPREDPRTREPRRGRTGFRAPWRRQSGRSAVGGAFAGGLPRRARARLPWIAAVAGLAVVGAAAGWLAGRWDEESWIGRQYQFATDLMQSVKPLPDMLAAAPATSPEPAFVDRSAASSAAATPGDAVGSAAAGSGQGASTQGASTQGLAAQGAPAQAASGQAAADPAAPGTTAAAAVDPRPAAVPPAVNGRGTVPQTRAETSLVPLNPTPAPTAAAAAPVQADEPWSVRDVQRGLARLGYYRGGVDGQVGPMTRSAVRAFQEDAGLRPTGRIEPALLTELSQRMAENTSGTNKQD